MKEFTLKEEALLRKFIGRGINCGHAVFKNTANLLKVELPNFSTMVSISTLYNHNKSFFECFEKLTKLAKDAISVIESTKEVKDLENTRTALKLKLENLYSLEHEEKNTIKNIAKSETKTEIVMNGIELQEIRKLKKEKREQLEIHRMEFQQSLRRRFEI